MASLGSGSSTMSRQLLTVAVHGRQRTVSTLVRQPWSPCTRNIQQRHLSTTQRLAGYRKTNRGLTNLMEGRGGAMDRRIKQAMADERPQRSSRAVMKDFGITNRVPTDLGLLPGTLVMPPWSQRPSLFAQPVVHIRRQGTQIWKRIRDFGSMLIYKFYNGRPFVKLQNRKVPGVAKAMHSQMYTGFANGNVAELRDVLCRGLFDHYTSRMAARPANVRYIWTLEKYTRKPRVVSQRGTFLPLPASKGRTPALRQAVVRIQSVQSLKAQRQTAAGEWVDVDEGEQGAADGLLREYDEYVVLQQRVLKGEPEDWRVWGTVTPTAWQDVERVAAQKQPGEGLSMVDEPADMREGERVAGAAV